MIKAIIFDVDDTLLNFIYMKENAVKSTVHALVDNGLNMELEDAYNKMMCLYWEVGIESDIWIGEFLKKYDFDFKDKIDNIKLIAGVHAYRKVKNAYLKPYPRVYSTLIKLIKKGIKLAILSDAPEMKVLARLEEAKLIPFFDCIISDAKKPEVTGFNEIINKFNLDTNEVIMIGDRPEKDFIGAKNAGIKYCFAKYGSRHEVPENCDFILNSFDEIIKIIENESE